MDDLIAFVNARLDEDEAAAKAAVPGPWRWGDWNATYGTPELERNALERSPEHGSFPSPARLRDADTVGVLRLEDSLECDPDRESSAAHIARHDPARVLREVAAKRRTLQRHQSRAMGGKRVCATCRPIRDVVLWPCPDLRDAAAIWSDHPDYRPEWKP